jgi:hypothetical protein
MKIPHPEDPLRIADCGWGIYFLLYRKFRWNFLQSKKLRTDAQLAEKKLVALQHRSRANSLFLCNCSVLL